MWAHLFLVFLAVTVETVAICLSPSPHFFLYFFKCNFYIACKAGFKVREQWRKWEGRLKNKKEKKGTVQEARIISALWWIFFLLALGIKTGVLKLNTKWKRLVRIVVVWGVGSCCSGLDTNQTGKILSWVNNISAEIYSTSSPKFHQLCFFFGRCLHVVFEAQRDTRKTGKKKKWGREEEESEQMRLCLHESASANRRDGSCARNFFQATQHGVSSFGEKWFPLNGHAHTWTHAHRGPVPWQCWSGWTWKLLSYSGATTQRRSTSLTNEGVAACERVCLHDVRLTGCVSLQNESLYLSQWGQVA